MERKPPKTMCFALVGSIYVYAHSPGSPTDAEWNEGLADFNRRFDQIRGSFVFTPAGGPNARQRLRLREMLGVGSCRRPRSSPTRC